MKDYREERKAKDIIRRSEEETFDYFFKIFAIITGIILLIIFLWIRSDINVDHVIDHALDIDTICGDCSSTVSYCKGYWKEEKKCGY